MTGLASSTKLASRLWRTTDYKAAPTLSACTMYKVLCTQWSGNKPQMSSKIRNTPLYLLHPTPLRDKQSNRHRHPLYALYANPLVKRMNITTNRSVRQGRHPIIDTMYPRVQVRRARLIRQFLPTRVLVRSLEHVFGRGAWFEDVAFGEEAVPCYFGRMIGKVGVLAGKGGDFGFDLFGGGFCAHTGDDGDATFDAAPGGDGGLPVAGVDDRDVEILESDSVSEVGLEGRRPICETHLEDASLSRRTSHWHAVRSIPPPTLSRARPVSNMHRWH